MNIQAQDFIELKKVLLEPSENDKPIKCLDETILKLKAILILVGELKNVDINAENIKDLVKITEEIHTRI